MVFVCATSCAPLTFSNENAIDFSTYPTVRVEVWIGSHEDERFTEYLVRELREGSGFEQVVYGPRVPADAVLVVDVTVSQVTDDEFEGGARYKLIDKQRRLIDEGNVSDESFSAPEVMFDVLDEVALHYLRAYRI